MAKKLGLSHVYTACRHWCVKPIFEQVCQNTHDHLFLKAPRSQRCRLLQSLFGSRDKQPSDLVSSQKVASMTNREAGNSTHKSEYLATDSETGLMKPARILEDVIWDSGVWSSMLGMIALYPNRLLNAFVRGKSSVDEDCQTCRRKRSRLSCLTSRKLHQ